MQIYLNRGWSVIRLWNKIKHDHRPTESAREKFHESVSRKCFNQSVDRIHWKKARRRGRPTGLAVSADVLVERRARFHAELFHVRHHLVGDFSEHFLGKHHLAAIEVVAEGSADELAERHKLATRHTFLTKTPNSR